MYWICDVTFPEGAHIVDFWGKSKADKIILSNLRLIEEEVEPSYQRLVVKAKSDSEKIIKLLNTYSPYIFPMQLVRMIKQDYNVVTFLDKKRQLVEPICMELIRSFPNLVEHCIDDDHLKKLHIAIKYNFIQNDHSDKDKVNQLIKDRNIII